MKNQAIVLLSGGLDSTTSLYIARKHHKIRLALTFDYGQRAAKREIIAARRTSRKLGIRHESIKLPWLANATSTSLVNRKRKVPQKISRSSAAVWVPNRNALFINIAAAIAEGNGWNTIMTGFNKEEAKTFPDNSAGFVRSINKTLSYSTLKKIKVVSYTQFMTKKEIVKTALKFGIKMKDLWWCYNGGKTPCMRCESCLRVIKWCQAPLLVPGSIL